MGLVASRDAVISEISDLAGAVQDINQCYSVNGTAGHSGTTHGMSFIDSLDFCDDAEDVAGAADNCITFDQPPEDEFGEKRLDGLIGEILFEDGISDTSPPGGTTGSLVGGATVEEGVLVLDGVNDALNITNSDDINLETHGQRTIALDFTADNVDDRQVLYEEGAGVRGLVIYIDDGLLYVGGWNIPDRESGWDPTYISTPISANSPTSVALVLDGTNTLQPDALTGYLNGMSFGSAPGSQLWPHAGGIGIGAINGVTIFHDGTASSGAYFGGTIDNFNIYNAPLTASEIQAL